MYLGYEDYDPSATSLSASFYACYLSLSAIGNDTRANDATTSAPLPCDLLCKPFGRPSPDHSFHQQACFETAYIPILKAGFFEPLVILALHECHPLLSHLICSCVHLQHYDFLWLADYNSAWASQDALSNDKAYAFLTCLIHYDLSIVNIIRFLRNNYTGKYHDILSIAASLRARGIAKTLIGHYSCVMMVGCLVPKPLQRHLHL